MREHSVEDKQMWEFVSFSQGLMATLELRTRERKSLPRGNVILLTGFLDF